MLALHLRRMVKLHPIFIRCVEGTLYDFCGPESSCLIGVGSLVPSRLLVQIARDIIEGLSYMHMKGEYHGNISVGTMFYCRDWNGEISVQLANFGFKEIPLKEAQRDDWRDFGKMLLEMEHEVSAYNSCHTSILVDFANLFINTTEDDLDTIKRKAYKHTFFSDTDGRELVSSSVSLELNDPQFCESLRQNSSKICLFNWGCPDYYTLLPAVNHCRQMDFGQVPYEEKDFTDVVKFVGFICDLYEYCRGIEVPGGGMKYTPAQMDELIISKHPRLNHELRKLMLEFASPEEKPYFGFFCPDDNQ
ncbi:hypothetical protein LUZ61_004767 [Rhynchospora tenuis]|uniref:Protein kinase domain-containing protein n=1 Tax=Rhynchospora tenuis TaxID=198213 RepID=A0AAD5ZNE4_9POAL|nr:hypothetical protein LUZ61_004767 [Rhynchospora tenuis]